MKIIAEKDLPLGELLSDSPTIELLAATGSI